MKHLGGRTFTLHLLIALLLSGLRSRHTSLDCHAGRYVVSHVGIRGTIASSFDANDFVAVLEQVVDAERGDGEVLRERARVRGEETSELWPFVLGVSSRQGRAASTSSAGTRPRDRWRRIALGATLSAFRGCVAWSTFDELIDLRRCASVKEVLHRRGKPTQACQFDPAL